MRDKISIRWALDNEGLVVQDILASQNVDLAHQVDWSRPLGPYWLLAVVGEPVGCINVNPGTPVGRLEWLTVRPTVPRSVYARACRDLCYAGIAVLRQGGSQLLASYVNDTDIGWKRVIERRKTIPIEHGTLYMRSVQ